MNTPNDQGKIYYYSLDPEITPKQLQDKETIENDPEKREKLIKWMKKYELQGITEHSDLYPVKFKILPWNPYLFYYQGDLSLLSQPILWIVGPRQMSPYAEQLLEELFPSLADKKVVTVSGLAKGIDQKCHKLSIKYHLPTIAVLGWGFRKYLEGEERHLLQEIIENGGCVISEFKLNFEPTNRSFPQRNRLIAGLSDTLFIPEAKESSWSLITADFALKYKKKIFVAPNQFFAQNGKGSNLLLAQRKAEMLLNFDQISSLFPQKKINSEEKLLKKEEKNLTENEVQIIKLLQQYENKEYTLWIDKVWFPQAEVLSLLTMLEIKGLIYQSSPGIYAVKG